MGRKKAEPRTEFRPDGKGKYTPRKKEVKHPTRQTRRHPSRFLHISEFETPDIPRYSDFLLVSRKVAADQAELATVLSKLESLLMVPKARVTSLVLDALALYAKVNRLELPFSEYTQSRLEDDKYVQRFLHWYWREVEKKRKS